jgi:hypothetical protein
MEKEKPGNEIKCYKRRRRMQISDLKKGEGGG